MNHHAEKLIENVVELVYFMRGAIQYDAMMFMTPPERRIIAEFISKRLEQEAKKLNPIY